MRAIKVKDLAPGVIFDKPVYIEGENLLLPANIPLRDKDLERLQRWQVETVYSDGEPLNPVSAMGDPLAFREMLRGGPNIELLKRYTEGVKVADDVLQAIAANKPSSSDEVNKIVESLYPAVRDHTDAMVAFTIHSGGGPLSLAESSVNCMILSTVIGLNLKLPPHRLIQLAIGALLHDIGMTRVPREILDKKEGLTDGEVRLHTIYSYSFITKNLKYPEEIGLIALQHHERWDGKGYPKGLTGEQIMLAARIVSIADSFEAMVRDRPYRNSMIGYTAMRQILNDNSRRFDSEVLRVFIKSLGIYPIGSIVLLNDASIGRVIKIHGDAPLRPVLRLIVDKGGRKYAEGDTSVVDLLLEKSLFIARAINPKEINAGKK